MSRALAWIGLGAVGISWLVGRKRSPDEDGARDEVDALARVITSEADGYSEVERTAIAWCVRNRARKRGTSIAKLVCTPTCGPCCHGRPFSSARPSTVVNRELAVRVLGAPQSADPTGGATSFFEPRVQDKLVAAHREGYRFTSAQLRERWIRDGQRARTTVGAFELWA